MPITDIFSKRAQRVPSKDVLTYDKLPEPLRRQLIRIWVNALGNGKSQMYSRSLTEAWWEEIEAALSQELALFGLARYKQGFDAAADWFMDPSVETKHLLDLVQLTFQTIDTKVREHWDYTARRESNITQPPDDAIAELNHRFLEHSVGYQFASGRIIRLDSTFAHAELIKPALTVIANKTFRNAEQEFLSAHEHYREQRYEECLTDALKAFETTMKIICHERKWKYNENDTAKTLINTVLQNGLVPASLQTQFHSLNQLMESGTPTTRNKMGGHGMGVEVRVLPDYLAAYGLQTAAANISLLVAAFERKGK